MKKVIQNFGGLPIKLWLEDLDEGTLKQTDNLSKLPFAFKHIAIMPDAHFGYGMPIGGVMAAKNVIVPNAVGKDIGCGMCAVRTSLTEIDTDTLKKILGDLRKIIPVGPNHHKKIQDESLMPVFPFPMMNVVAREYTSALKQLGTLGSGNHFIEIQQGSDGHIWLMVHSGSRNFGMQIADYYNKVAIHYNEKGHSKVPKEWELAFLPLEDIDGQAYLNEMNYAVEFALANRKLMMQRIMNTVEWHTNIFKTKFEPMINIAHNYASLENHFGENVWVHRKGATLARDGTIGIIPGSQGTKSYIVKGLGNKESFESCSHGAGRRLGRREAVRSLDLEAEKKALDDLGILHAIRNKDDLEEAPSAYKDIDIVMENQKDLVEILVELKPLAVIKG